MRNVLVIAAHPDDEILGCGGTIVNHIRQGDKVHSVILAEGITSRDPKRDREERYDQLSQLAKDAERANQILGVHELILDQFPDNRMDQLDRLDIIKVIEQIVAQVKPDIVYTHHIGDVNIDHRRIHEAVITACRPIPGQHLVKQLLFFETVSSTEWMPPQSAPSFNPNWYVDISHSIETKLKALQSYTSEMRDWPHPRSIEGVRVLSEWRGSSIGIHHAEAFILGRNILINENEENQ
ncbi:PIG-L deacetylase family protein [Alkalibacillus almallahensis]|uniref:PIG-L deacetylase family protein n=1 Tax=Alkalibacillus almallahensis TaxID=1379154 RepID=UPI0014221A53|nr:PIG-L deacetylase family protein [Alkalibacillus almallahensis]NIK12251.1 LmbE family N-acetylglucosaminyl deacetylase [Alkalibacillus almallahensis]